MKMKKFMALILAGAMVMGMAACGSDKEEDTKKEAASAEAGAVEGEISIMTREDGSGTRGAFVELFGIEEKDADGNKMDMTTDEAAVTNSTSVMMTSVAGDERAIGYISLGSLNDTVKALKIDGAEATAENVANGSYKIARPFNIITNGKESDAAKDFVNFIMSAEGQQVLEDAGCIKAAPDAESFASNNAEGKVVIAGSSSITPSMEKLKEAYAKVSDKVEIEVQQSDSTTGVTSALDGVCDIGMASRELKDSEIEAGAQATVIAQDGIAVIVNKANALDGLTADQVKSIYTGETLEWSELN